MIKQILAVIQNKRLTSETSGEEVATSNMLYSDA